MDWKKLVKRGFLIITIFSLVIVGTLSFGTTVSTASSFDISTNSITTDDGELDDVTVDASGTYTYDGAENPPGETDIILQVKSDNSGYEQIAVKEDVELNGLAGEVEYTFSGVSVLEADSIDKSYFEEDADGVEKTTSVEFKIVVDPSNDINGNGNSGDGSDTTSSSTETSLTVTNEQSTTNVGGSGDINGEGEDKDPSDNKNNNNGNGNGNDD